MITRKDYDGAKILRWIRPKNVITPKTICRVAANQKGFSKYSQHNNQGGL